MLIVAHPDDDILWLSSIVDKVDDIVFCLNNNPSKPDRGSARKKILSEYPLSNIHSLDLDEIGSYNKADWERPEITEYGLKLVKNKSADKAYREVFQKLLSKLSSRLSNVRTVFTHNPWGEYGHEDHVLVYRAVKALQSKFNYNIWFSNYCSNRSLKLMNMYISGFNTEFEMLSTNKELASSIAEIYKTNNAWTWYDEYKWFDYECIINDNSVSISNDKYSYGYLFPLNYIKNIADADHYRICSGLIGYVAKFKAIISKILSKIKK